MKTSTLKTWCNIDLDAIAHNYNYIKSRTNSRVVAVVKANAYGHGAVEVSLRLQNEGCDFFAVSSIEEALNLRNGGISCDILVLGYILPQMLKSAIDNNISFTVSSLDTLDELCKNPHNKKAKIHIKLDTGMNRIGFNAKENKIDENLKKAVELIKKTDNIELCGVFSHLAKAGCDESLSRLQYERYIYALDFIKKSGLEPKICHICNSNGTDNFKDMHMNAVRAGIILYGLGSDDKNYIPAMDFCTRIVAIHTVKKGEGIGYGHTFTAEKDIKIATIGAGYADGLLRSLSNGNGKVLVNGVLCPITGKICMDMSMIDITDVENVKVGDVVTIWGKDLKCDIQAYSANTISYELVCGITPRVTKVYN